MVEEVIYRGFRPENRGGPATVYKIKPGPAGDERTILSPRASQKLFNHSPDGFGWGYRGSGPAQLALALLLDTTGDNFKALKLHQDFKEEFVAGWGEQWEICQTFILLWCGRQVAKL